MGFRKYRNEGDEAFLGSLWQDYQEALGLVCEFTHFRIFNESLSYKRTKWELDKPTFVVLVYARTGLSYFRNRFLLILKFSVCSDCDCGLFLNE